jgi:hypothetical protein
MDTPLPLSWLTKNDCDGSAPEAGWDRKYTLTALDLLCATGK